MKNHDNDINGATQEAPVFMPVITNDGNLKAASATSDIGKSRRQRVFCVLEDVAGTFKFPSADDFIRPAGNAVLNQSPAFTDSAELQDTLDLLDQFQNAMPAGEFTIPMYARPTTVLGGAKKPQGHALFMSMQGLCFDNTTKGTVLTIMTTASLATIAIVAAGNALSDGNPVPNTTMFGAMPNSGVIKVENEYIYYASKSTQSLSATKGTLTGCIRAYSGATATHAASTPFTFGGVAYKQSSTSPAFSLWIETDFFMQGLCGCSVNSTTLSVTNEGAVNLEFSGQGMKMIYAGTTAATGGNTPATTTLFLKTTKGFSEGIPIQNKTKGYNNVNKGYVIKTIVDGTKVILDTVMGATAWAAGDTVCGYLPTASVIGKPIESRFTKIKINNIAGTFKSGDLTIGTPKQYIIDEVGTLYPQGYMEDRRDINSTMSLYFRQADARYFTDGYAANEVPVKITYGNVAGTTMEVYMRRCRLQVPTIEFAAPAVNLSIPLKSLGTQGEDSMAICFI